MQNNIENQIKNYLHQKLLKNFLLLNNCLLLEEKYGGSAGILYIMRYQG